MEKLAKIRKWPERLEVIIWPTDTDSGSEGPPHSALGAPPHGPPMSREQELEFLKEEAKAIKEHLEDVDAKIRELEAK